jgi:transposase-like protein
VIAIDRATLRLIFNAIRTSYKRSSVYEEAIAGYLSRKKGPRGGSRYDCQMCKKPYTKAYIEMDHHPEPVVPIGTRWYNLSVYEYYDRVFNGKVRALCKSCHKKHTKEQKKQRK